MRKLKRIGITLMLALNLFSFNAYASPHDQREIYEIEQRNRAVQKIDTSCIEIVAQVMPLIIYGGAFVIFTGVILLCLGFINNERKIKACLVLSMGAMLVSIRTWFPLIYSKTPFYDEVVKIVNSIQL